RPGARRQHGTPASAPDAGPGGRHHRQGGADPFVEPCARGPQGRQADQGWLQDPQRRPQGALCQRLRRRNCGEEIAMAEDDKPDKPAKPAKADRASPDGGKQPKAAKAGGKGAQGAKAEKGATKGKGDQGAKAPKPEKVARAPRPKDY